MLARQKQYPAERMLELENGDDGFAGTEVLIPEEENDTTDALLQQVRNDSSYHASSRFVYADTDGQDYAGDGALYRVLEELQFGHDLQL